MKIEPAPPPAPVPRPEMPATRPEAEPDPPPVAKIEPTPPWRPVADPKPRAPRPGPANAAPKPAEPASDPIVNTLLDSEFSLEVIYQATPRSRIDRIGVLTTATVSEAAVEFPNVALLETNAGGLRLVSTAIDVRRNAIEIDFDRVQHRQFGRGHQNTYVFRFDRANPVKITGARIDRPASTLGLADSDVSFSGNELHINVEGLPFNRSTFVRILLDIGDSP